MGCTCPGFEQDLEYYRPTAAGYEPIGGVCRGVPDDHPGQFFAGAGCVNGWTMPFEYLDGWVMGGTLACATPAACTYFYSEIVGMPGLPACAYSDLTVARSGVVPEVDCTPELRANLLCGVGCECEAREHHCYGVSEEHPVGACVRLDGGSGICARETDCTTGERCMIPLTPAEWLPGTFLEPYLSPIRGRCAASTACAAAAALYPDTWQCT